MFTAMLLLPVVMIGAGLGAAALGLFSASNRAARSWIVSLKYVSLRALDGGALLTLPAMRRKRSAQGQASTVRSAHHPPSRSSPSFACVFRHDTAAS
jgi:hypothetical protein